MTTTIKIGNKAPEFSLQDQNSKVHSLEDYLGKKVLIYFYPKDDTPGCTTEACSFRDNFDEMKKLGLVVLGISKDSVGSHKKFADKYNLTFPILSDEDTTTIQKYGAWRKKKFMGKEYMGTERISFLIDEKGNISKIYESVKPETHVSEIIDNVKK